VTLDRVLGGSWESRQRSQPPRRARRAGVMTAEQSHAWQAVRTEMVCGPAPNSARCPKTVRAKAGTPRPEQSDRRAAVKSRSRPGQQGASRTAAIARTRMSQTSTPSSMIEIY